jgi:hypothetical protein
MFLCERYLLVFRDGVLRNPLKRMENQFVSTYLFVDEASEQTSNVFTTSTGRMTVGHIRLATTAF